jgi:arylsulfatase A-like enzyme
MAIKNDYLLDMIARFVESLVQAMGKGRDGRQVEALVAYEDVVGTVLDMDPEVALALSPASLVTMMQISAVDESLAVYAAYALERAAQVYDAAGDACAQLRRAQAAAVADAYGFPVTAVPHELEEALAERERG